MKINVKVVPRASKNEIIKEGDLYKVRVTSAPVDGAANKMVVKLLAKEFGVSKSSISVVLGENCRHKVMEIKSEVRRTRDEGR